MKCLSCGADSDEHEGFEFDDGRFFICDDCLVSVREDALNQSKASHTATNSAL